jgi:hypothetical protein
VDVLVVEENDDGTYTVRTEAFVKTWTVPEIYNQSKSKLFRKQTDQGQAAKASGKQTGQGQETSTSGSGGRAVPKETTKPTRKDKLARQQTDQGQATTSRAKASHKKTGQGQETITSGSGGTPIRVPGDTTDSLDESIYRAKWKRKLVDVLVDKKNDDGTYTVRTQHHIIVNALAKFIYSAMNVRRTN